MNLQAIQKDLSELRKGIDLAKTDLANLDGRKSELLRQLEKNHELSSEEEVNEEIKRISEEMASEEAAIEKIYKELKEDFSW
jgi:hypothetical protein